MREVKFVEMKCKGCNNDIKVPKKEFTRQVKNGREQDFFFCSGSCAATYTNNHVSDVVKEQRIERMRSLASHNFGNQYNVKGEFTYIIKGVRHRCRLREAELEITEEFLQELWTKQNGRCAITGVSLVKPRFSTKKQPNTASLDRIDSSRGYTRDNVQFLAYSVNMAKSDFTEQQIREFFSALA